MHNYNTIIFYDFETCSRNPYNTQPIQIAAVAIHPRRLEIIPNSEFESMIYASDDEEYRANGNLSSIEEGALKVNNKTRAEIDKAPKLESVWPQFIEYVNAYNYKKTSYSAPILAGFNNNGFDDIILNRICGPHGWNLGPWNKDRNTNSLFSMTYNIDLFKIVWTWFENTAEPKRLSMDAMREFLGMDTHGSHDALVDVKQGADMLCRFLKLQRSISPKVRWNNG